MLTDDQLQAINEIDIPKRVLTVDQIELLMSGEQRLSTLGNEQLYEFLIVANALYRAGIPIISDDDYDEKFLSELRRRNPSHPFLQTVEKEESFGKTVELPVKMLSTSKVLSKDDLVKWLDSMEKAAQNIDLIPNLLQLRVTPKLDGFAAYDDGLKLMTRGDGKRGTDITRVFEKGLKIGGTGLRGKGPGELVIEKIYFQENLSEHFDNTRNVQAAILAEKKADPFVQKSIDDGAAVFFPFADLPAWEGAITEFRGRMNSVIDQVWNSVKFDVDGVVIEVTDPRLKSSLGSTRRYHRWQVAYKENTTSAEVGVLDVKANTSRLGRVNPVIIYEPTKLSGATLSRATAHHFGMVKSLGIGPGAVIEIVRSGLVIPKLVQVVSSASPKIPDQCPSCSGPLAWDGDYLFCLRSSKCPAQTEASIEHFFRTLGNVDGFGSQTVAELFKQGVRGILDVYQLTPERLVDMDFGEKTAQNLITQLRRSRTDKIEDWRFLAAFGVKRLGTGNCERLLQHASLQSIFDLSEEGVIRIKGFAAITARAIVMGLKEIQQEFEAVFNLGFTLEVTANQQDVQPSLINGKIIVFTGTMGVLSREEMQKEARGLGAKVATSVSGKTDYLVTGQKVGAKKINDAKDKGVHVLSEKEYRDLIDPTSLLDT